MGTELIVNGIEYKIFISKYKNRGYRLSAITLDKHPYRIIRNIFFSKDIWTPVQIEKWAINILS